MKILEGYNSNLEPEEETINDQSDFLNLLILATQLNRSAFDAMEEMRGCLGIYLIFGMQLL